jgi:hypothetical protein
MEILFKKKFIAELKKRYAYRTNNPQRRIRQEDGWKTGLAYAMPLCHALLGSSYWFV